ncbi:hypothetical protein OIU78_003132 [Salix suchowensis]|nr:hypothetical protein OIU78_003132 [Salix suchowensis]
MSYRCFGATNCCKGDTTTTTNNNNPGQTKAQEIATDNVKLFSYNSLRSATRNFHPSNRIGAGGFGIVYKGVLRDGTLVAVKSLSVESKQGKDGFVTEIRVISNIKHPNLLELIGCCVEDNNRILIYEYMENNSLSTALLGSKGKHIAMGWATRAAICLGIANGLAFLHEEAEPHVVHRDIKASNVLLDGNLQPKNRGFWAGKTFSQTMLHILAHEWQEQCKCSSFCISNHLSLLFTWSKAGENLLQYGLKCFLICKLSK